MLRDLEKYSKHSLLEIGVKSAKLIFMELTLKILLSLAEQYNDTGSSVYNPLRITLRSLKIAELRDIFNAIGDKVERLTLANKTIPFDLVTLSEDVGYEISRYS